jgi:hypothetical protein
LKKILDDLNQIKEDKLDGIKLNKMDYNNFLQINKNENLSAEYTKILFNFKNMIYFFDEIIPKEISILELENSIFAIYYKYYKKKYEGQIGKDDFEDYFPFILLSNNNLKDEMKKKLQFSQNSKRNLVELYKILSLYDGKIDFNENKKEISINELGLVISLNENINIEKIQKKFKRTGNIISSKIILNKNIITYYYPNQYYKEQNLIQIYFFFKLFMDK